MKRLTVCTLWVAATWLISGCGDDDEMKRRCLDFCKVFERCVPDKPAEAEQCRSSCDAFDDPDSAEEYKEFFLCKEKCVDEATSETECICLLKPEDGGPDC
jgi:hypothetical protein